MPEDFESEFDNADSSMYLGGCATAEDYADAQEWEAYDPYDCEDWEAYDPYDCEDWEAYDPYDCEDW